MQGQSEDQRQLGDVEVWAGHLLPTGSVFAFLAAQRRELFPDELFADLFRSARGRPSVPADVVATVIVLQSLHGLSDREAAEAVTFDLRWKAAVGLAVEATSFHPTTLTYWRRRLAASDRPNRIFEVVRQVVDQTGVLKGKSRRALDSTVLDDAVATQDTVTQLIAAVRRVRRDVGDAAAVIAEVCSAHDYDDPGKPAIAWDDEAARAALVDALVADAHRLLGALPEVERDPKQAEALALLALIAGQDVEWVQDENTPAGGRWAIARRVAADRVISAVDPDARHAHKTVARRQDGFKAHIAVEPETGLVTDCRLSKASGDGSGDAAVGIDLIAADATIAPAAERDEPIEVLGDSAYGTGDMLHELTEAGLVALVSLGRSTRPCRQGSPLTTSPSTSRPGPRPARTASPGRSTTTGRSTSVSPAAHVRCAPAAPAAVPASRCGYVSMTRWLAPIASRPPTPASRLSTVSTGRWSNVASPGSSPTETDVFATAGPRRTMPGCTTAPPP